MERKTEQGNSTKTLNGLPTNKLNIGNFMFTIRPSILIKKYHGFNGKKIPFTRKWPNLLANSPVNAKAKTKTWKGNTSIQPTKLMLSRLPLKNLNLTKFRIMKLLNSWVITIEQWSKIQIIWNCLRKKCLLFDKITIFSTDCSTSSSLNQLLDKI